MHPVEGHTARVFAEGTQLRPLRLGAGREAQLPPTIALDARVDAGDHRLHALLSILNDPTVLQLRRGPAAPTTGRFVHLIVVAVVVFEVCLGLCASPDTRHVRGRDRALELVRRDVKRPSRLGQRLLLCLARRLARAHVVLLQLPQHRVPVRPGPVLV